METRERGKAITGIAIAAVMLALVFAVMVPTGSATDVTEDYQAKRNVKGQFTVNPGFLVIDIAPGTDAIKIGQEVIFKNAPDGSTVLLEGVLDSNTDGESFSTSVYTTMTVPNAIGLDTVSGIYFDTKQMRKTGTYIVTCTKDGLKQNISVSEPNLAFDLKVGPDIVSTIASGTHLRFDAGEIDLGSNDCVDLEIVDPDGRTVKQWTVSEDTTTRTQYFDDVNVATITSYGSTTPANQINTENWLLGTYTFSIVTEEENARGLDLVSTKKKLTVLKGEVDIDVDNEEVEELEPVTVTVTGIYGHNISIEATAGKADVQFEEDLNDFPDEDTHNQRYEEWTDPDDPEIVEDHCYGFNLIMEEDGQMEYSVIFHDSGAYTFEATDLDLVTGEVIDLETVDIKVAEKKVIFDMPSTVTIGEDIELAGTSSAGDFIDIAVDDYIVETSIPIEEDGSFEEDLYTPETRGTGVPGSIRIEAFIRLVGESPPKLGKHIEDWDDDGSMSILMTEGILTAEISALSVAQDDDFSIVGIAEGSDFVDIITIAPKGGGGEGMDPNDVDGAPGITHDNSAVSDIDYGYFEELDVDDDADTGAYVIVVLSPGRNGYYDGTGDQEIFGEGYKEEYGWPSDLGAKDQEQIIAILQDATMGTAGSDDLMWLGIVRVQAQFVLLDPIADVGIGEPLVISGTSNREEGFTIVVTVKGPTELLPATVQTENGTYNATIDTTDATVGTYVVEADDGDGNIDEKMVNIGAAAPIEEPVAEEPTEEPVAEEPTEEPVVEEPVVEEPVVEEPAEEPTTPGFGGIIAIAGLLAIAYLVLRRRK